MKAGIRREGRAALRIREEGISKVMYVTGFNALVGGLDIGRSVRTVEDRDCNVQLRAGQIEVFVHACDCSVSCAMRVSQS